MSNDSGCPLIKGNRKPSLNIWPVWNVQLQPSLPPSFPFPSSLSFTHLHASLSPSERGKRRRKRRTTDGQFQFQSWVLVRSGLSKETRRRVGKPWKRRRRRRRKSEVGYGYTSIVAVLKHQKFTMNYFALFVVSPTVTFFNF